MIETSGTTSDTFTLFSASTHVGNFSSIAGSPGAGLAWSFTNGVLSVVTAASYATYPTNLTVSALDGSGITAVNFYVNGAFQATDTSPPYSCSWTVPAEANQPYYVTAKAFDGAGNQMTSIVYYVSQ